MPGKNARNGRRGLSLSPLDMAEDSKNHELVAWLRAQGCYSGDGSMSEFHVIAWQAKGWHGNATGFRSWSSSWGSRWGSASLGEAERSGASEARDL